MLTDVNASDAGRAGNPMLIDQGDSSVDNDSIYCDMIITKAQAKSRAVEKSLVDQKVEVSDVNVKPFLNGDESRYDVQSSCTNIGDTFQEGSTSSDTSDVELVSDDLPECDRVVDIGLGVTKEQLIAFQQSDPSLKLARSEVTIPLQRKLGMTNVLETKYMRLVKRFLFCFQVQQGVWKRNGKILPPLGGRKSMMFCWVIMMYFLMFHRKQILQLITLKLDMRLQLDRSLIVFQLYIHII